jgi:hypothetical protein
MGKDRCQLTAPRPIRQAQGKLARDRQADSSQLPSVSLGHYAALSFVVTWPLRGPSLSFAVISFVMRDRREKTKARKGKNLARGILYFFSFSSLSRYAPCDIIV